MPSNSTITYAIAEELKQELGIPTSNESEDISIELALESVSRSVEDYTHRRFHTGIATSTAYLGALETRYYTAECASHLRVDDLLQLAALRTDNNGNSSYDTTHSTALVYLTPFNAALDDQPYTDLILRRNASACFPVAVPRGVQITGVFGFCPTTAVLPVIKKATLLQAAMDFRAKDSPMGAVGGRDFTMTMQQSYISGGLHPFVRRMLDPYRIRVVA